MKLNFPDMLKLASKGYKPNDIAEISAIEETDLNKEQLFSLIDNGYNLDDIKFLRGLLSGENNVPSEESEDKPPEEKPLEKNSTGDNTGNEDQEEVDYKSLYEKEKKLREKLQHSNASELNASGEIDKRTNEEIAQDIANAILN
jgi:hypothetical protein